MDTKPNQVVCGECGKVRLETPPGTTILPTLGMAKKAAGTAGKCDCGRAPHERPGGVAQVVARATPPHDEQPVGPATEM